MRTYSLEKGTDIASFGGRVLFRNGEAILGYTNSYVEFKVKGESLSAIMRTGDNLDVDAPGLRIYMDGVEYKEIVLDKTKDRVKIWDLPGDVAFKQHTIRIVKITEAAMSFVAIGDIEVEGELERIDRVPDHRKKFEFIGDSITCGFGVRGEPEAEYTIRDEDGEQSYAAFLTKSLDLNSRWVSVSGYGVFADYTGSPMGILPKVYGYTNWFYDKEEQNDHSEFEPDVIVVNLGTNDSGHFDEHNIIHGFKAAYESFLYTLRTYHKDASIVCVIGTLSPVSYEPISEVVTKMKDEGFKDLYLLRLPEHDTEKDGMASFHPSAATHKKDAARIEEFLRENRIIV